MTNKWRSLYDKIPADRRARIEEHVAKDLAEMPLGDVRRARELTQQQIARNLDVNQAWVSKIEHQTDMYISTLRSYIEAMGGELQINVRFDDGVVRLTQFEDLGHESSDWIRAEHRSEPGASKLEPGSTRQIAIWTTRSVDSRIWQAGDQTATTRSQTPSSNTPGSYKASKAA
jgi:transcriptional regulator with XRE-family HTH domain